MVLLAALYGICMGAFALIKSGGPGGMQMVASMIKVPALFALTLGVTFPSLYVFNALIGSRLRVRAVLKLLLAAMGVTMAVLASLGPIEAFFAVSSTSYDFMVLLNVLIFAVAGLLGLGFLLQTLHRLSQEATEPRQMPPEPPPLPGMAATEEAPEDAPGSEGPLAMEQGQVLGAPVKAVFRCWILVFGLVGAQMAWLLRPFIGDPTAPFAWFRARESNFFEAVWGCLVNLFS